MTKEQSAVVDYRLKLGYTLIGVFNSLSTNGDTIGLTKGKHRMQINRLGWDEYTNNPASYINKGE